MSLELSKVSKDVVTASIACGVPLSIKEEDNVHEQWYKEAKDMTIEKLPMFVSKLSNYYDHDYGTICHAMASAAVAAATAVDHSPSGGITGFQASAVFWEFMRAWNPFGYGKNDPVRLVNYENMLYPQYEEKFDKIISQSTWEFLQKEAVSRLKQNEKNLSTVSPIVMNHWKSIADGNIPFGYKVKKED